MVLSKSILTIAAAALSLGVIGDNTHPKDDPSLSQGDILIVQNDTTPAAGTVPGTEEATQDSAKISEEQGTHTGHDQSKTPENDTQR